jgi:hypothetical protein
MENKRAKKGREEGILQLSNARSYPTLEMMWYLIAKFQSTQAVIEFSIFKTERNDYFPIKVKSSKNQKTEGHQQ